MDWIEDIIQHTLKYYNGRKIVLWGKYEISENIKTIFNNEYGIDDICFVDSNPDRVDNFEVFPTDYILGKNKKIYIVISLSVHQSIREKLKEGKYKCIIDYYYFSDCATRITEDYYEDAHRNKIIGKRDRIKYCFSSWDSMIVIGEGTKFDGILEFYMHNGNTFELGDKADVTGSVFHLGKDFKTVKIGKGVYLKKLSVRSTG